MRRFHFEPLPAAFSATGGPAGKRRLASGIKNFKEEEEGSRVVNRAPAVLP